MELILLVIYGTGAGAVAGTLTSFLAPLFWTNRATEPLWRTPGVVIESLSIVTHALAGMALAFLFWLSWGLTAIVGVTWWQRGLSFAALAFGATCLPLLLQQALHTRVTWRIFAKSALDALISCAVVGLVCAYSWSNGR